MSRSKTLSSGLDLTLILQVGPHSREQLATVLAALEPTVQTISCRTLVIPCQGRDTEEVDVLAETDWARLVPPAPAGSPPAAALNAILRKVETEAAVLLSTDCIPDADWLPSLLDEASSHPEAAFVASRVVFHYSPDMIQSAGIHVGKDLAAYPRGFRLPALRYAAPCPVLAPSRQAGLIRPALMRTCGFFDEAMSPIYGDADLGLRALLLGFEGRYAPAATCRYRAHLPPLSEAATSYADLQRDRAALVFKNLPAGILWRCLPAHAGASLRDLAHAFRRKQVGPYLQGRLRFWRDYGPLSRHRNRLLFDPRSRFERLAEFLLRGRLRAAP